MRRRIALQIVMVLTFGALCLSALWISTFFLTGWLYAAIGYMPPPLLALVINALLGVIVFLALGVSISFWINSRANVRRRQLGVFEPIIEAMQRIAKGDFRVRLNTDDGANGFTSELAKSVNQMAEELNQMEHMRQEFIANVSHEIQSPLTSIRGFAQALHDEHLSVEERLHYLTIIETESTRLSRMTDNMLKLASLEAEHMRLEMKPYRLDKQMRMLVLACELQWMSKAIEMEVVLEEVEIVADEDLLSQVWSNLLHNSIKFTPEGGKVYIGVQRLGDRVEYRITDTGIGIAEETQGRVFERFYRADRARERTSGGSGLGLTIAKKVVELHGGSIKVTSQIGAGTTFIVSLPVAAEL